MLLSPIAFYAAYSQHAFLDEGTRTRLLERELVPTAAVLRDVLPPVGLELIVPVADLGVVKPPRKLQRDLTRAAHALVFQRLMDSPHCVRNMRVLAHPTDAFLPFLAAPTSALLVEPPHFTVGLRSYLLLHQLLRLSTPPVLVDHRPRLTPQTSPMRLMLAATAPVASAIATLPTLMPAASLQIKFATGMNWSRR